MNRLLKLCALSFLSVVLFSCGNNPSNDQSTPADEPHADHLTAKEDSVALSENADTDIRLNAGEKWLINDEMKPHIADGEAALNDYIASNGTDYKALAAKLKEADNALISSCTMEGESHDELHKWLHPHLELVNELANAQNEKEADAIVKKLDKSYDNFWVYFE